MGMKRNEDSTALLALGAVAAVGIGAGVYFSLRKPLLKQGDLVGLVGDSLAVGLGAPLTRALGAVGIPVDARGKGATIASGWLAFDALVTLLQRRPRAVVVVLGTNDCHYAFNMVPGGPCERFPERISALAQKIRAAGAVPVMVAMPPMEWESDAAGAERMKRARTALEAAAKATSGLFVAAPPFSVPRWNDKLHPNEAGSTAWAEYLTAVMRTAKRLSWD